ncbi:MAG: hypothetical protein ACFE9Z_04955 [Promethearchaeota archaeon]
MIEQNKICRKCILPEGFLGVHLNDVNECEFCSDPKHRNVNWSRTEISDERRKTALTDWELVIKEMKRNHGSRRYDCILGYSGGKDSTALLDYLVNDHGLTPLAVTSDTGFMTDIAKNNIKDTLEKIQVDHVLIEDCIPAFTKLYKYHFLYHNSDEVFLARNICDYCSDLIHSIVVKEAIRREIPYVLFGYSPDQIFRYFYEIPKLEIVEHWRPSILESLFFEKDDARWYLTTLETQNGMLPRVLLPYHVIPYREQDIIDLVESKNYVKKGHADPLLTNCNVIHAAMFYDLNRYGGILYAYQYAELVRQNPSTRKKWLRTLKMIGPLILENKFKPMEVNTFFKQIGISQDQMLEHIREQLNDTPYREDIEQNIEMFRKRSRSKKNVPIFQ